MSDSTPFLTAIFPTLPPDLSESLAVFQTPAGAQALDNLIRFVSGGASPVPDTQQKWAQGQQEALSALGALTKSPSTSNGKRPREQDADSDSDAKRQKTDPGSADDGAPLFTLHSISTNSPIRKKVDITVHASCIKFLNASTHVLESSIPLSSLTRAFLLPTRGKMKAHWTVVLLSSDTPERGKKPAAQSAASPQVIFGLDATPSAAVKYSTYTGPTAEPELHTLKGGTPTRELLVDFIGRLSLPVLEPVPEVFKSACPGIAVSACEGGVPGIEAYRAAKAGTLWFLSAGVLWGESKPCEFWALEDLLSKEEGLRVVSATGRTCTVVLTRKSPPEELAAMELDEGETDPGVEAAFALIDGKEQEGINKWVRAHRELFGKEKQAGVGAVQVQDDSDEEDDDFEADSESDGGSASEDENEDDDDDDDDDGGGSGSEEAEDSGGEDNMDEDDGELKAENHPLMRPGAMPRMSRAAIDMVAAMVGGDLVGEVDADGEDEGEDELDD